MGSFVEHQLAAIERAGLVIPPEFASPLKAAVGSDADAIGQKSRPDEPLLVLHQIADDFPVGSGRLVELEILPPRREGEVKDAWQFFELRGGRHVGINRYVLASKLANPRGGSFRF